MNKSPHIEWGRDSSFRELGLIVVIDHTEEQEKKNKKDSAGQSSFSTTTQLNRPPLQGPHVAFKRTRPRFSSSSFCYWRERESEMCDCSRTYRWYKRECREKDQLGVKGRTSTQRIIFNDFSGGRQHWVLVIVDFLTKTIFFWDVPRLSTGTLHRKNVK